MHDRKCLFWRLDIIRNMKVRISQEVLLCLLFDPHQRFAALGEFEAELADATILVEYKK